MFEYYVGNGVCVLLIAQLCAVVAHRMLLSGIDCWNAYQIALIEQDQRVRFNNYCTWWMIRQCMQYPAKMAELGWRLT